MKARLFLVSLLALSACDYDIEARAFRTLTALGFTSIELGNYAWFECSENETNRAFTAISPSGQPVSGVVCCGVVKRCTVRF